MSNARRLIGILACTQIASWGSVYYAFSIVAPAIARDLALGNELVYGAFSWSLLVAGVASAPAGMLLDRFGGRPVMSAGSVVCGAGLLWLSSCGSVVSYYGAWTMLGLAMTLTLYEAAFATINRQLTTGGRQAISTVTLFGGFASTIFWPLTWYLSTAAGWRGAYLWFGVIQLAICLPLHLLLGPNARATAAGDRSGGRSHTLGEALRHGAFWKLAMAFAANTFTFAALSVHLLPLLTEYGHPEKFAVLLLTLIGPMQVAGRVLERTVARDVAPQTIGKLVFTALPASLLALMLFGEHGWAAALFCCLYGLSNGVLTIVRGTIPQELFGRENYGAISGAMAGPSLVSKAAGPLAAAMLMQSAPTPSALVLLLLGCALMSLAFYFAAIKVQFNTAAC
ncbi:MFS transporter [Duganella sp. FT92W]|uniref:MFS transporter n=1 Tax=Pseudoduganella rivuli TaxID=2666085 RepID=A0A7X2IPR8_9BURK|nr:MFS transporter [Pseudoduganella rivuli]MRV73522.1 MFS transporter [Pseudoduganella rivuli]